MLGEVQYTTGIPRFIYPVVSPLPRNPGGRPIALGDLFTPSITSVTTSSKGSSVTTGSSGFQQISSTVGDIGKLGLDFFKEYNDTSIEKKKLKYEKQIAELQANLSHLTEKERIAAQIEISKIQAQLEEILGTTRSQTGLEMTKIIALAGVASLGILGAFVYLSKKG